MRAPYASGRCCSASAPCGSRRATESELVEVCPLCQEAALDAGWVKEGSPTSPTINLDRRRRRGLGRRLGVARTAAEEPLAQQDPILRRLSDEEIGLLEAADIFNASAYRRTVGGIVKSLGVPQASIVPLSGTTASSPSRSPGISPGTSTA